jgi:hypothetical protein
MANRTLFFAFFLCLNFFSYAENNPQMRTHYELTDDPIDVVIVSHPKDKKTLDYCIDGIRENCNQVRRVIVVSSIKLTDKAEWFNEDLFPFSKDDVALTIARGSKKRSVEFFRGKHRSPGWYFQQLLKFYSPFVIPDISSNALILDADTIFMNPVEFLNESHGGLFSVNHVQERGAYFQHAERLVPGYKRIYPEFYSVCHHMLFQKPILEHLFHEVEQHHKTEFWVAFCLCVDLKKNKGASEYEIYFNFALSHADQVKLRELKWTDSSDLEKREKFKRDGYHFVAFHTYLRKKEFAWEHLLPPKSELTEIYE